MRRLYILLISFLFSFPVYGQQPDSVIYYPDGHPKYVQTYDKGRLVKNVFLSNGGDTIYQWDAKNCTIEEYSYIGEYLQRREFDSIKKQEYITRSMQHVEHARLFQTMMPVLESSEWRNMHDHFYYLCSNYTRILREGDFLIYIDHKRDARNGAFKKYYNGRLVVEGQYKNDSRSGIWHYYPYHFYPYLDITFHDVLGREWSILYTCIPAALCILLLLVLYWGAEKTNNYRLYFFGVLIAAFVALALRLFIPFTLDNVWIRYTIPALWFTLWHAMMLLTVVNLFRGKKIKIHVTISVLCLLIGLIFSVYVLFFKYLGF